MSCSRPECWARHVARLPVFSCLEVCGCDVLPHRHLGQRERLYSAINSSHTLGAACDAAGILALFT